MKLIDLIKEAKSNAREIAIATQNCPRGKYTAFYLGENGYRVGYIQIGFSTEERCLGFGSKPLSESCVLAAIQHEYSMLN